MGGGRWSDTGGESVWSERKAILSSLFLAHKTEVQGCMSCSQSIPKQMNKWNGMERNGK